jgi:hypothetical protein
LHVWTVSCRCSIRMRRGGGAIVWPRLRTVLLTALLLVVAMVLGNRTQHGQGLVHSAMPWHGYDSPFNRKGHNNQTNRYSVNGRHEFLCAPHATDVTLLDWYPPGESARRKLREIAFTLHDDLCTVTLTGRSHEHPPNVDHGVVT